LIYSPFVQAEDNDEHVLRDLYFRETFENIDYLGFGGELVFDVSDSIFISGAVDVHTIPEARGDMEIYDAAGNYEFNPGNAGIENTAASVSAMLGLRF
jgi:outer membrane protease